jgi:serine/threonine protein kinase
MFSNGQQIGPYSLVKLIGRGGFGEVWLAERRAKFVTTKVAIKLPLEEQAETDAIKNEAVLLEQASGHPNVLPIIEADEYDGQIVIVSEYAPDGSLDDLLKRDQTLTIKRAVDLAIGILCGLECLHSKEILHRDLKPGNILLQGNTPRLTDFGISRVMRSTISIGDLNGTPAYMAPEVFDRKRSEQTDVWSVGVILYEMLHGDLPFRRGSLTELFASILQDEPNKISEHVPPELADIILKALEKAPNLRYHSAKEMHGDLSAFSIKTSQQDLESTLSEEVVAATLQAAGITPNALTPITEDSSTEVTERIGDKPPQTGEIAKNFRLRPRYLTAVSAIVLVLILGGSYYLSKTIWTDELDPAGKKKDGPITVATPLSLDMYGITVGTTLDEVLKKRGDPIHGLTLAGPSPTMTWVYQDNTYVINEREKCGLKVFRVTEIKPTATTPATVVFPEPRPTPINDNKRSHTVDRAKIGSISVVIGQDPALFADSFEPYRLMTVGDCAKEACTYILHVNGKTYHVTCSHDSYGKYTVSTIKVLN